MQELIEVRISKDEAASFIPPGTGEDLGGVLKLMLKLDDPLIDALRAHEQQARRQTGLPMISSWAFHRRYTAKELLAAELFSLNLYPRSYPTGAESGTVYDESRSCEHCGVGERQVGPLRLDLKKIPKRDIAQTFSGEIVVSSRLALGERFGTGRPEPLLFISPRLSRLFTEKKVKRFIMEVAYLSQRQ